MKKHIESLICQLSVRTCEIHCEEGTDIFSAANSNHQSIQRWCSAVSGHALWDTAVYWKTKDHCQEHQGKRGKDGFVFHSATLSPWNYVNVLKICKYVSKGKSTTFVYHTAHFQHLSVFLVSAWNKVRQFPLLRSPCLLFPVSSVFLPINRP